MDREAEFLLVSIIETAIEINDWLRRVYRFFLAMPKFSDGEVSRFWL